ncbi:MAG: PEGA domain-containing protein [Myxococcota bacterium]|nr:PEGA domain-containing protein [Myxococcota bacterium]
MQNALSRALFVLATALALLTVAPVPAAQAEPPEIETNYQAGKAALKSGDLDKALSHLKTALAFSKGDQGRTWQMLLAIAFTYKERSEPHHAFEYYRRFLKATEGHRETMRGKWIKRLEIANRDLAEVERLCEATHGFVSINTEPAGAKLIVDGQQGGADGDALSPFLLILPAGPHTIRVELEGHEPFTRELTVRAGGSHPIKVTLKRPAATVEAQPAPPPPVQPAPPAETTSEEAPPPAGIATPDATVTASASGDEPPSTVGPWITIGAAAATGIAGVVMTGLASEENKTLENLGLEPQTYTDVEGAERNRQWNAANGRMETYQLTASILYGVAAATAVGGVVWLLVADPGEGESKAAFGVVPTADGIYSHASWRF